MLFALLLQNKVSFESDTGETLVCYIISTLGVVNVFLFLPFHSILFDFSFLPVPIV